MIHVFMKTFLVLAMASRRWPTRVARRKQTALMARRHSRWFPWAKTRIIGEGYQRGLGLAFPSSQVISREGVEFCYDNVMPLFPSLGVSFGEFRSEAGSSNGKVNGEEVAMSDTATGRDGMTGEAEIEHGEHGAFIGIQFFLSSGEMGKSHEL